MNLNLHNWHKRDQFQNYRNWFALDFYECLKIKHLGFGEFSEMIIQEIYISICNKGDLIIDGGANRGRHTFPMSEIVGESGIVLAYEANPYLEEDLRNYIKFNSITNIKTFNCALSSKTGQFQFHILKDDGRSSLRISKIYKRIKVN